MKFWVLPASGSKPRTRGSYSESAWSREIPVLKIVPQLDTWPELIEWTQTPLGRIGSATAFSCLLLLNGVPLFLELGTIAGILSFLPAYRRPLVSAAALYWLIVHHTWVRIDLVRRVASVEGLDIGKLLTVFTWLTLVAILCGFGIYLTIIRRWPNSLIGRRPVLVMIASFLGLIALAETLPFHGPAKLGIWLVLALTSPYLWFFAYAASDYKSKTHDPYHRQFGTFFPFWIGLNSTSTPFGKGAAYLRKVEARTGRELAVVQLKAIKLLIWLLILNLVRTRFISWAHGDGPGSLAVPTIEAALEKVVEGERTPAHLAWASVLTHFGETILWMTTAGNVIVACCRMAGFKILRNTYKPLYANSIAEFWSRYYFYFKELLVEFFFYPVYLRYFKRYRRLRLAAATMSAATIGNMLFHFCRDIGFVFDLGLGTALAGFQVYAFYATILGLGVTVSQLRGKRTYASLFRRTRSVVGVVLFYMLIEVFDYEGRSHSLRTHFIFFSSLLPFTG
jgi:hypothetical protein